MRSKQVFAVFVASVLLLTGTGKGNSENDDKVLRDLKASTFALVRVDVDRANLAATYTWVADAMGRAGFPAEYVKEFEKAVRGSVADNENWVAGFKKAGGRWIYCAVNYPVLRDWPYLVVPIEPGADPNAIAAQLEAAEFLKVKPQRLPDTEPSDPKERQMARDLSTLRAERIGDVVAWGTVATLKELKAHAVRSPANLRNLKQAFDAADPRAGVVIVGTVPRMEPETQPATDEISAMLRKVRWVCISLRLPPHPAVRVVVQTIDAPAAAAMRKSVADDMKSTPATQPSTRDLLDRLVPNQQGDRLLISLDEDQLREATVIALRKWTGEGPTTRPGAMTRP